MGGHSFGQGHHRALGGTCGFDEDEDNTSCTAVQAMMLDDEVSSIPLPRLLLSFSIRLRVVRIVWLFGTFFSTFCSFSI